MRQPIHQHSIFKNNRAPSDAGIAIGVVLFVIALLAVLAIAMSSGSNTVGSTVVTDRVRSDVKTQANLIRAKIMECNQYSAERGELGDKYPYSNASGTSFSTTPQLVSSLNCLAFVSETTTLPSGLTHLWTGAHQATLGPPSNGLDEWYYVNAGSVGGRCIRIQPLAGSVNDTGIRTGLSQAFSAFSSQEGIYAPGSSSQRFILWITAPSGTPDSNCQS